MFLRPFEVPGQSVSRNCKARNLIIPTPSRVQLSPRLADAFGQGAFHGEGKASAAYVDVFQLRLEKSPTTRELRDRWLEQVNSEGIALPAGKYDVSRRIGGAKVTREAERKHIQLLSAPLLSDVDESGSTVGVEVSRVAA